jgi:uncharacterized membrane protein
VSANEEKEGILGLIMLCVIAAAGIVSFLVLAIVFGALIQGYVLSKLLAWFIVPKFGLPALSILEAFALMLTAKLVTGKAFEVSKEVNKTKSMSESGKDVLKFLVICGFMLLMGWILSSFIVPELPK